MQCSKAKYWTMLVCLNSHTHTFIVFCITNFIHCAASTINGLTSVRAYKAFDRFESMMEHTYNAESASWFTLWSLAQWLALRFNVLVTVYTFLIAIIAISTRTGNGALGSLAVSYSLMLSQMLGWSTRNLVELESFMTRYRILVFLESNTFSDSQS
jgi:hypothetical protein